MIAIANDVHDTFQPETHMLRANIKIETKTQVIL